MRRWEIMLEIQLLRARGQIFHLIDTYVNYEAWV